MRRLAVAQDQSFFCTASDDGTCKIWATRREGGVFFLAPITFEGRGSVQKTARPRATSGPDARTRASPYVSPNAARSRSSFPTPRASRARSRRRARRATPGRICNTAETTRAVVWQVRRRRRRAARGGELRRARRRRRRRVRDRQRARGRVGGRRRLGALAERRRRLRDGLRDLANAAAAKKSSRDRASFESSGVSSRRCTSGASI